ncbi:FMN-linked oxidoreductase [Backusella circina FSU 941]|nr:FMN-linked oxidoreductase [Backusella circina FSU 941]
MSSPAIFTPLKIGNYELKHRVVMAPLTRFRSDSKRIPTDLMKEYYTQRATSGGLLITEATFISKTAGSFTGAPGIFTDDQIKKWKTITDSVHEKGGIFFCQLWHLGRADSSLQNGGHKPVSASDIPISGVDRYGNPHDTPHPLTVPEIKDIIQDYRQAAVNAIEAGFDGVEIHAANGYLLDQFINTSSNRRTDTYGGSIENRCRFTLEVVKAISDAIGPEKTAIRFSPWSEFQDMEDATPYETWGYLVATLQNTIPNLSYLHFVEPRVNHRIDEYSKSKVDTLDSFRKEWKGSFISAGSYTLDVKGAFKCAESTGNLIAFGRLFIANPDLVERLQNDSPLNKYDRSTFYTHEAKGYTDYPFYK